MPPEFEARAVALEAKIDAASARWDALLRENERLRGNLRSACEVEKSSCAMIEALRADGERRVQWQREAEAECQRLREICAALQTGDGGREG